MKVGVYSVYEIAGPDGTYIGATGQSVSRRWSQHMSGGPGQTNSRLHASVQKHGKRSFAYRVLAQATNRQDASYVERAIIAQRVADGVELYNSTAGGGLSVDVKPRKASRMHCPHCGGAGHQWMTCMYVRPAAAQEHASFPLPAKGEVVT